MDGILANYAPVVFNEWRKCGSADWQLSNDSMLPMHKFAIWKPTNKRQDAFAIQINASIFDALPATSIAIYVPSSICRIYMSA
jgi:hypothetical protein